MSRVRTALWALGAAVAALGVLVLVVPGLAGAVFAREFHLSLVGLLALVQGGRVLREGWRTDLDRAETGDPELVEGVPTPGDDFDDALATAGRVHVLEGRGEVEERLERAAREVLQRRRECAPEEARRRLAEGDWTDDPLAASFFAGDARGRLSWRRRVRIRLGSRSLFELQARSAASELERIWREES